MINEKYPLLGGGGVGEGGAGDASSVVVIVVMGWLEVLTRFGSTLTEECAAPSDKFLVYYIFIFQGNTSLLKFLQNSNILNDFLTTFSQPSPYSLILT